MKYALVGKQLESSMREVLEAIQNSKDCVLTPIQIQLATNMNMIAVKTGIKALVDSKRIRICLRGYTTEMK